MKIKSTLAAFNRRLERYEDKALTACGHADLVIEANERREELMKFVGLALLEAYRSGEAGEKVV